MPKKHRPGARSPWLRLFAMLAVANLSPSLSAAVLPLYAQRAAATDLALTGRLVGVPAGETRFARWADLRALPSATLTLTGEFQPGTQEVTVVFLEELWKILPRGAAADALLATCSDGYASVYRADLMASHRPFLILEINGLHPDRWAQLGLSFNPVPYAISVNASVASAVAQLLDAGHKRPWSVTSIEVASYADRFHDAFDGRWGKISPQAEAGCEIWINSCASCHPGPGNIFGGTKGGLPFELIAAHARDRPDFFATYIRAPKTLRPDAKMDSHPHYTVAHIAAVIAFVTAEPPVRSALKDTAP